MRKSKWIVVAIALILGLSLIFASCAPAAETAAEFYKGKTIDFSTSVPVGGSGDLIGRLIAPILKEYIDASAVIVTERSTAGGIDAWNYTYMAKPDGLTIAMGDAAAEAVSEIFEDPAVRYETAEFEYLWGLQAVPTVFIVQPGGPIKSIDDLRAVKEPTIGAYNPNGNYGMINLTVIAALGLDDAKFIGGPGSSERILKIRQGEMTGSILDSARALKEMAGGPGVVEPLFIVSPERHPGFPGLPTLRELVPGASSEFMEMISLSETLMVAGENILTTPGVPQDRVKFLSDVIMRIAEEQHDTIEELLGIEITKYDTGADIKAFIEETMTGDAPAKLRALFATLLDKHLVR